jgi:hypothetical protein
VLDVVSQAVKKRTKAPKKKETLRKTAKSWATSQPQPPAGTTAEGADLGRSICFEEGDGVWNAVACPPGEVPHPRPFLGSVRVTLTP